MLFHCHVRNKMNQMNNKLNNVLKLYNFNDDSEVITRKYYDPILSNRIFDYQNEKNCVIVLSQRDMIDYDKGFIEIVSLDKKSVIERLSLPAISEMTPIISDVNQDGNLDLLINCSDGYLYCFSLNNK